MRETWDQRIRRARELAAVRDSTRALLEFYADLLVLQKALYDSLRARSAWLPSGSLEKDRTVVRATVPAMLRGIQKSGPPPLVAEAGRLLDCGDGSIDDLLLAYWRSPSDQQFFAKAVLQPYAQYLAETRTRPVERAPATTGYGCPFCGGAPQVSILEASSGGDGAGRWLLCATCLTPWPFRRVVCAHCGEADERKLAYWHAHELDHLRVDACESCKHYLKSVDRTRLGLAVPLIDEVAGASLDLWARERGYEKIELNLVGL